MTMIHPEDQGHRHGNFPNYYSFHPPANRLEALFQSGILNYIFLGMESIIAGDGPYGNDDVSGIMSTSRRPPKQQNINLIGNASDEESDDLDRRVTKNYREGEAVEKIARKKQRMVDYTSDNTTVNGPDEKIDGRIPRTLYYCDLGCNEGDLTMEMARALATMSYQEVGKREVAESDGAEKLENPVNKRMPLENQPGEDATSPFGTKQPNINFPGENCTKKKNLRVVKCLGLDLDPMLIERAKNKFLSHVVSALESATTSAPYTLGNNNDYASITATISASFQVCNLSSESEHHHACASFHTNLRPEHELEDHEHGKNADDINEIDGVQNKVATKIHPMFHLTTIFSTTMWIHLHSGDEGLRRFLERACCWTKKFILVEPQPSACYRKANTRLRKMGRPELDDITSNRLKMRPDIEAEIEKVIIRCGFRKVSKEDVASCMPSTQIRSVKEKKAAITAWNRSLHLYERIDIADSASLS